MCVYHCVRVCKYIFYDIVTILSLMVAYRWKKKKTHWKRKKKNFLFHLRVHMYLLCMTASYCDLINITFCKVGMFYKRTL